MRNKLSEFVTFRASPPEVAALKALAATRGVSYGEICRRALAREFETTKSISEMQAIIRAKLAAIEAQLEAGDARAVYDLFTRWPISR